MSADLLLSRLDKVKPTGQGRWVARCPAHDDKGPSLAVRELDDGRVLVHCFAGCDVLSIVGAVSLDISDLFPPRPMERARPERRPFPAADVLRCVAYDALTIAVAGAGMVRGESHTAADQSRLVGAAGRIEAALIAGGVTYD